jgi:hypothetical protein
MHTNWHSQLGCLPRHRVVPAGTLFMVVTFLLLLGSNVARADGPQSESVQLS